MGDVIKSYLANVERELKTGRATEHTHRPALKDLLEGLDSQIKATNEPKRVERLTSSCAGTASLSVTWRRRISASLWTRRRIPSSLNATKSLCQA